LKPVTQWETFMVQTIWVITNTGMKNQIAKQIFDKIMNAITSKTPISQVFKHKGKVKAINHIINNAPRLSQEFQTSTDKLEYLETLQMSPQESF